MQNTERDLKLYYSISEVAQMFDVNESLLRFWEKEFPQISPKKGSRGVRQYRKEDVETIRLIYHLVKERGMTLPGARHCSSTHCSSSRYLIYCFVSFLHVSPTLYSESCAGCCK